MSDQNRADTVAEKSDWKMVGLIALALVTGAILVGVLSTTAPPEKNTVERIEEACQREFGSQGERAVLDCRLRLSVETLERRQQQQMDAARDAAR